MSEFTTFDFGQMRQYFFTRAASDYAFRERQLHTLKKAIQQYEQQIMDALLKDLHKSPEEAFTTEIGFVYAEISHALKHLKNWMRTTSVATPFFLLPSKSRIVKAAGCLPYHRAVELSFSIINSAADRCDSRGQLRSIETIRNGGAYVGRY